MVAGCVCVCVCNSLKWDKIQYTCRSRVAFNPMIVMTTEAILLKSERDLIRIQILILFPLSSAKKYLHPINLDRPERKRREIHSVI